MKQLRITLLLVALVGGSILIVSDLRAQGSPTTPPAATPTPTPATMPTASSRAMTENGRAIGEVLIGNQVALRLREAAGGYTPAQRAEIIATRVNTGIRQGYVWQDVRAGTMNGQAVLLMGDVLVATVSPGEGRAAGISPLNLAYRWQDTTRAAMRTAVASLPVGTTMPDGTTVMAVAGTTEAFPAWTNPATKIVPILSVGTPGVSLGFAQVTGPSERTDQVRAVFQVDLTFQRVARIFAFVPSDRLTGVSRVQGVAVTALLQYGVFQF